VPLEGGRNLAEDGRRPARNVGALEAGAEEHNRKDTPRAAGRVPLVEAGEDLVEGVGAASGVGGKKGDERG
jgi:hypothetical protein